MAASLYHKIGTLSGYRIFADGTELSQADFPLELLSISKKINRIPTAQVILQDGSIPDQDFPASNRNELSPGTEISIRLGYDGKEEEVFKGILVKHGLKSRKGGSSLLIIELKDEAVKMTVGRKNNYYEDSRDSEIMEDLIGGYGLNKKVERTAVQHHEMVQYFCTDWDFLLSRAEANGQVALVNDGKITVETPSFRGTPKLQLTYGQNIVEFETEMDARDQYAGITASAWDFSRQEIVESEGKDPKFKEQGNINAKSLSDVIGLETFQVQHSGRLSEEELQSWSDALLLRSRLSKIKGRIRIFGIADIQPGDLIELGGLGDRFNGIAYVSGVDHSYGLNATWHTDLHIGLDKKWLADCYDNVVDHPSAGLIPAVNGLQIGLVTAIHDDPDGEDRIQVRIPVINTEDNGLWARVVNLDAGENRGFFFRPEVGDEVIVGFLNDDPRDPIVLGTVFSSAKPAPIRATEENNEKGLITRSEMKMLFDDNKISWTLETPNGNTIVVSDDEGSIYLEDENGNKLTMDADGISIESAKDISLKATGDIKLEGVNIEQAASAQFKAEGSAGAEVSSSANAVIKGAIVQIN